MATISFARGVPSPDLLPTADFGECARAVVERDGPTVLNYGPPGGYRPLREWVAERHHVPPERVILTNGSLQGFGLLARAVLAAGARVLVEAPTYDRTLRTLASLGAQVEPVALETDGLDMDGVARVLPRRPPALLYTIPTFQNPSGHTLSLEKRRALADLALTAGLLVYEDDPYHEVRFAGESLPTLHELAGGENVVYSSSFSKTVAPGIRVGYLVLPERLVETVEALALESYLSPTIFVQGALHEFLRQKRLEPHLERVRPALRARRDAMVAALARELSESGGWNEPEGGYFLWLDLPDCVDAAELLGRATEAGVTFVKGADFYAGPGGAHAARLAFSFADPGEIDEGVARLGRLVREAAAVAA